jgi:hypothetical protein
MARLLLATAALIGCASAYTDEALADQITSLPGAPDVAFNQFSGYLPIDEASGLQYFYWFVEREGETSPADSPVALWTNGGPGCSGLTGFMTEQGPFRPNANGTLDANEARDRFGFERREILDYARVLSRRSTPTTVGGADAQIYRLRGVSHPPSSLAPRVRSLPDQQQKQIFTQYAWNKAANMLFVEQPVGVGFSYSTTRSDYHGVGDADAAADNYQLILQFLKRFPECVVVGSPPVVVAVSASVLLPTSSLYLRVSPAHHLITTAAMILLPRFRERDGSPRALAARLSRIVRVCPCRRAPPHHPATPRATSSPSPSHSCSSTLDPPEGTRRTRSTSPPSRTAATTCRRSRTTSSSTTRTVEMMWRIRIGPLTH